MTVAANSTKRLNQSTKRELVSIGYADVSHGPHAPQDLRMAEPGAEPQNGEDQGRLHDGLVVLHVRRNRSAEVRGDEEQPGRARARDQKDRKSTRLNSSHSQISYAVFCLKKKK